MVVFDKSNVYFVWDDLLIGRPCYYADSITDLVNIVTIQDENDIGIVTNFGDIDEPFVIDMKNSILAFNMRQGIRLLNTNTSFLYV